MHSKISKIFALEDIDVKEKSVFLKPSFVFPVKDWERIKNIITNPYFCIIVAQVCVENGAKKVFIGESETNSVARYAFEMLEIKKKMKILPKEIRAKIELCYLDEVKNDWITPENPFIENIKLDYPKIVQDVDVFISLPKLKVNVFANITLSVKNGMGLICKATRLKYHNGNLHKMIADIYQIRPPDYTITDAIFAGEGQGPMSASPYPLGLLIFGNNGLAVDAVCCNLMGYDPFEIEHLKLLNERGYGSLNIDEINIAEKELIQKKKHTFNRPTKNIGDIAPGLKIYKGTCCESGCDAFLQMILEAYIYEKGPNSLNGISIITGKNPVIPKEELRKLKKRKTIVFGNCASSMKKYGVFFGGCTPDYIKFLLTSCLRSRIGMTPWIKYVSIWAYIKTYIEYGLSKIRGNRL